MKSKAIGKLSYNIIDKVISEAIKEKKERGSHEQHKFTRRYSS